MSAAETREGVSGLATPGTVTMQATSTVDATVTALSKEKLAQEVQQLKQQNTPDLFGWLRTNAAILLSTLVVVIGGLVGLFRWFGDQRSEREKRVEERFQAAVTWLGDDGNDKEGARIDAAILLRTFLRPGYEQFYTQIFDLAVANLCRQNDSNPSVPPKPLSRALIFVFKEAFPLARERTKKQQMLSFPFLQRVKVWLKRTMEGFDAQCLDATDIKLDQAYLNGADLKHVWMPRASLQGAYLIKTDLTEANLHKADLSQADLHKADLSQADLTKAYFNGANLSGAKLSDANLSGADLSGANLSGANLSGANLSGANLHKAILTETDLGGADLSKADLHKAKLTHARLIQANLRKAILTEAHFDGRADLNGADLYEADLSEANLSEANLRGANLNGADLRGANLNGADLIGANLNGADLRETKGLMKNQLQNCKVKDIILDEDFTSTSELQLAVVPSSPPQGSDAQASSALFAQEDLSTPGADGSSVVSAH